MSQAESKAAPVKPKRKLAKDLKKKEKEERHSKSDWKSHLFTDTCVQVTAWLLLTVGLCIIASTIYVGVLIQAKNNVVFHNDISTTDYEYLTESSTANNGPVKTTIMLNQSVRSVCAETTDEELNEGCNEYKCKVTCMQANQVYETLYKAGVATLCPAIDVLLIKEQTFPSGFLRNDWIDFQRPVSELVISNSSITLIKSGAFNTPLFTYTNLLSLSDLQLKRVGSGALLGLLSLRYLIIDTPIKELNRAFFQPVQSTLLHLRMNCGLHVLPGQPIFGGSTLAKLEYADLSNNVFTGPLTRQMFRATPNLRYLHLSNSQISAINSDAFEDLKDVLKVLDLSENLLTTISINTIGPLLVGPGRTLVSLAFNRWNCVCQLQEFAEAYRMFRKQFLGTIYCHSPFHRNGETLNKLNFEDDVCTETATNNGRETTALTTITYATSAPPSNSSRVPSLQVGSSTESNSNSISGSTSRSNVEDSAGVIQMHCLHIPTTNVAGEHGSTRRIKRSIEIEVLSTEPTVSLEKTTKSGEESVESEESTTIKTNPYTWSTAGPVTRKSDNTTSSDGFTTIETKSTTNPGQIIPSISMTYYKFEIPSYTFELTLMANKSVKVLINNYNSEKTVNIIWFSRQNETNFEKNEGPAQNIDYYCEKYAQPYLIANDLDENCTYTFCMLPVPATLEYTISPFNCLPMYVPPSKDAHESIWISEDEKQFTISMLCLIFTLSIVVGGIIAYFGIRTYPELLEGSKNVLVVKRSESESGYLKSMCSIKKKPLSRRSTKKLTASLPETPPTSLPPPPPFSVSTYNLERFSSIKSSSTYFENSFAPPPFSVIDDQYELPKPYHYTCDEERCVPNTYAMSPCSPPPLPKRNPSVTSSMVASRTSKID
ncbi:uncharacterized protein LOC128867066 [Anastrepha ludens]|uniref:uncharacterized protein LOC128867066 n=1 Tax=Anastrepha ludens TaxID=28586 RepID=UPI0023AEF919|nr:uncharacterized protein LOC128867066 [Anastrepha ludens]